MVKLWWVHVKLYIKKKTTILSKGKGGGKKKDQHPKKRPPKSASTQTKVTKTNNRDIPKVGKRATYVLNLSLVA